MSKDKWFDLVGPSGTEWPRPLDESQVLPGVAGPRPLSSWWGEPEWFDEETMSFSEAANYGMRRVEAMVATTSWLSLLSNRCWTWALVLR